MVVIIFCFNRCAHCRHRAALGMAYLNSAFSVHCLCKGHGHHVIN